MSIDCKIPKCLTEIHIERLESFKEQFHENKGNPTYQTLMKKFGREEREAYQKLVDVIINYQNM